MPFTNEAISYKNISSGQKNSSAQCSHAHFFFTINTFKESLPLSFIIGLSKISNAGEPARACWEHIGSLQGGTELTLWAQFSPRGSLENQLWVSCHVYSHCRVSFLFIVAFTRRGSDSETLWDRVSSKAILPIITSSLKETWCFLPNSMSSISISFFRLWKKLSRATNRPVESQNNKMTESKRISKTTSPIQLPVLRMKILMILEVKWLAQSLIMS